MCGCLPYPFSLIRSRLKSGIVLAILVQIGAVHVMLTCLLQKHLSILLTAQQAEAIQVPGTNKKTCVHGLGVTVELACWLTGMAVQSAWQLRGNGTMTYNQRKTCKHEMVFLAAWLLLLQQLVSSSLSADNHPVHAKACVVTEYSAYLTLSCMLQLDVTLILGLLCCQHPL